MADEEERKRYADVEQAVQEHNLYYPLTAVNGTFRFAGAVSYYGIMKVLREVLGEPTGQPEEA